MNTIKLWSVTNTFTQAHTHAMMDRREGWNSNLDIMLTHNIYIAHSNVRIDANILKHSLIHAQRDDGHGISLLFRWIQERTEAEASIIKNLFSQFHKVALSKKCHIKLTATEKRCTPLDHKHYESGCMFCWGVFWFWLGRPWIQKSSDGMSHFSGIFPVAQGGFNTLQLEG